MSEGLDGLIHAPQRLRIGAADSVVSKHLKALVDAGYVEVTTSSASAGGARGSP